MLTLSFVVIHPMLCIVPLVMANICGLVVNSANCHTIPKIIYNQS